LYQIKQSNRKISCAHDNILFFQTYSRGTNKVVIHTKKRCYVIYNSINKILAELPTGQFYKCHKSFVVNINNITESGKNALNQGICVITMPDGAECHVSRRKINGLIGLLNAL